METKPHFYHALRIAHDGERPRHFRKVTRSKTFPDVLAHIMEVAFQAKRLFGSPLTVEFTTNEIPVLPASVPDAIIDDDDYVEADPLEFESDGGDREPENEK